MVACGCLTGGLDGSVRTARDIGKRTNGALNSLPSIATGSCCWLSKAVGFHVSRSATYSAMPFCYLRVLEPSVLSRVLY